MAVLRVPGRLREMAVLRYPSVHRSRLPLPPGDYKSRQSVRGGPVPEPGAMSLVDYCSSSGSSGSGASGSEAEEEPEAGTGPRDSQHRQ
eukprot:g23496.t1